MTEPRPLAVVTGASSGIGFELAKQFAEHGFDLVVNAEDDELHTAAAHLRSSGANVQAVQADLTHYDGVEKLYSEVVATGRSVDAAALNAGVGLGGPFLETDLARELSMIELNCASTIHLAKRLLRDMHARNSGRVLFTSSIASTMPGPFQTVYNATKSFVQSFAEALQNELKDTDITITALMPGPTETEFFERAEMADDTAVGTSSKDSAEQVAKQGFEALMSGRDKIVAGSMKTKASGLANKVTPDSAKAAMHRMMAKPGSGKE